LSARHLGRKRGQHWLLPLAQHGQCCACACVERFVVQEVAGDKLAGEAVAERLSARVRLDGRRFVVVSHPQCCLNAEPAASSLCHDRCGCLTRAAGLTRHSRFVGEVSILHGFKQKLEGSMQ